MESFSYFNFFLQIFIAQFYDFKPRKILRNISNLPKYIAIKVPSTPILYLSHFWRVNPYGESSKILIFATVANVIMLSISKLFTRPKDRNWMNGSGPRAMQPLERAYTICLKKVLLCKWLSLWFFSTSKKLYAWSCANLLILIYLLFK